MASPVQELGAFAKGLLSDFQIAATALAFKANAPNSYVYTAIYPAVDPAISTCAFRGVAPRETAAGTATQYATIISKPAGNCAATTTCGKTEITVPES